MEHYSSKEKTPKIGYLTIQSAYESALAMKHKYKEPFKIYKCSQCGLWHVGHEMENIEKDVEMEGK